MTKIPPITISFQLSLEDFTILVKAYCIAYNYQSKIPDYNKTTLIDNPELPQDFCRRMLIKEVVDKVKNVKMQETPLIKIV